MDYETTLLQVEDISKRFGITVALDKVSFRLGKGEILGLIGENGSGKSTMSSIISGMLSADSGKMLFDGQPWAPGTMVNALRSGVGMVVQESGTVRGVTAAENIFLGDYKRFKKGLFIDRKAMYAAAQQALDAIGCDTISPDTPTNRLDMQDRKLLEIARVMYYKPRVLIIDETTTVLAHSGRELLYRLMRSQAESGNAVVFISHDLPEMMEHCDRLIVLRDGVFAGELRKEAYSEEKIKQMMVGRELKGAYYRTDSDPYDDEVVLKADCITTLKELLCFSLELHKGEILGIGGLSHCGMHTLGRSLYGLEKVLDGEVRVAKDGQRVSSPKTAFRAGLGYIAKNRDRESLEANASIRDNISSSGYTLNQILGPLISFKRENAYVQNQIDGLRIKSTGQHQPVRYLSGGNKQKVVFGKWIACGASILIMDCPTRGVDVGVKAAMYQLIYDMKRQGKSIVIISEELQELMGMCDRLLIMKDGQVSGEFMRADGFNENTLIECMI